MNLLRLTLFTPRHLLPSVQTGSQLRLFASVTNGKKGGRNNATVNKNGSKSKKLTQGGDDRPLTIYPFSINDLQKPQTKTKTPNKDDTKTDINKTGVTPVLACKLDAKPASKTGKTDILRHIEKSPILDSKVESASVLTSKTDTTPVLTVKTKAAPLSTSKTDAAPVLACKIVTKPVSEIKTESKPVSTPKTLTTAIVSCKIPTERNTQNEKIIDKKEMDAEKRIQAILSLSNKLDITNKIDVQPKQTAPVMISRQFQSSSSSLSSNQNTGGSSQPPPSSSTSQYLWIGAAAAIVLGGGAYIANSFSEDKSKKPQEVPKKPNAPKKPKVPLTSAEIPKEVPYLLIGGGTASFAAFRAIKSHDPKAKVMVLSDEYQTPYMRPPLSKELWLADETVNGKDTKSKPKTNANKPNDSEALTFKQWNGIERSLYYEPNDFYTHPTKLLAEPNGGVAIVRGYAVKKVDVENRIAILTDGTEIKYGKCLIATGSSPKNLPVFENAPSQAKDRISLFKTIEDYASLKKYVDQAKSVAIIGGGFLGSELACALAKYGEEKNLKVHQVFHEKGNMGKVLPEFLSEWTTERVREEGVDVIPNTEVQTVNLVNNQVKLSLTNGQSIVCDHVVVAVGSSPNTALGEESGLEIETNYGGYLVNAELAARNNLYVAGDAACFYDPKLGRRRVEHHDHAVVSGRLAGENMVGLSKPYTHQSMFWSDLGPRVGYEALGIIDSSLPTVSVFVKKPEETTAPQADDTKTAAVTPSVKAADASDDHEDFSKGVVFYLRDEKIVGIVLWNVFNRINTARAVLGQDKKYDDLNEVAKLFDIHV